MAVGSTFRRCSCRGSDGKGLGQSCPRLRNSRHGQWFYRIELPADEDGNRRPRRRGGFADSDSAQKELDHARALLALPDEDDTDALRRVGDAIAAAISERKPLPTVDQVRALLRAGVTVLEHPTVEQWLLSWLPTKKRIKRNTYRSYESHIRLYLVPYLGTIRLDKLRVGHVSDMFDAIVEHNDEIRAARESKDPARREAVKYQRPVGPTSMQRIRETLRTALNAAIREELISFNAGKWVELPPAHRPKPMVWTAERVEHWRRTGQVPGAVMVWTPEQTGAFLDHAVHDRLYALYHLIAHRGLRRGEACGQRWIDTHLDAASMDVRNQIVQYGWETGEDTPKTDESTATVALDADTVMVLRAHRARQDTERTEAGSAWRETGLLFTEIDGSRLHPADVTDHFRHLTRQAGLPPIRLHDLRHGTATTALAAGVDMKVVQHMLRHASITTTSDLYTNVLPELARTAAEATARMIPRAKINTLGLPSGHQQPEVDGHVDQENDPETTKPQLSNHAELGSGGTPPGTRTPNPLVKSQLLCQLS
jgi:integrase